MSIEITLRLQHPQEIMTILSVIEDAANEAGDCYEDNGDPLDAQVLTDILELRDALWTCFHEQGYEIIGAPGFPNSKVMYQGEELNYRRIPKIEPVVERDVREEQNA